MPLDLRVWEGGRICLEPGDRLRSCPSKRPFAGRGPGMTAPHLRGVRAHPSFLREETGFFVAMSGMRVRRGTARRAQWTVLWLALAMSAACGDASRTAQHAAPITVIDDAGRTVAL